MLASECMLGRDQYEKICWQQGQLVCGLDEVGRGCLAGPLVTAAVILQPGEKHAGLRDSKELSATQLQIMATYLRQQAVFAFGITSNYEIDRYNIYQATLLAMRRATFHLFSICQKLPALILVDAMPLSLQASGYNTIPIQSFPKAENYSISVAAASILAKVYRDQLMQNWHHHLPQYNFQQHKGYGTRGHQAALQKHDTSLLHRRSFLTKLRPKIVRQEDQYGCQATIFR